MFLTPSTEIKRNPSIITIVSMAKHSKMPECDLFINPHAFYSVHFDDKNLSGFESYVQGTIFGYMHRSIELLSLLIEEGMQDSRFLERGLSVVVSCSSGQRCSIAVVELLSKSLSARQIKVKVIHEMEQKWLKF